MRTIEYKQSPFGKLNTDDASAIIKDLEAGEESAIYIGLMAQQLVVDMKALGAENFGPEQAKEIIFMMIAKGMFTPLARKTELA